ncbi:hypothetical protein ACWDUL_20945 [Nocardia niigatensis]
MAQRYPTFDGPPGATTPINDARRSRISGPAAASAPAPRRGGGYVVAAGAVGFAAGVVAGMLLGLRIGVEI